MTSNKDLALEPVPITLDPLERHLSRKWQGIPGVERTAGGRVWVTFYSGGDTEGPENFSLLIRSDDDGKSWTEPVAVVDPPDQVRSYDPCLWVDPRGRLWWFWAQSYTLFDGRCGVWATRCDDPDAAIPIWSPPRRIADGIMMNKPTVAPDGKWLLPCAVWSSWQRDSEFNDLGDRRYSNVVASADDGEHFDLIGSADVPDRSFDEHMIVVLRDGRLWMLVRTHYGVGQSFSSDGGRTWTPGERSTIAGPDSRFFIRRLHSGRLLLVNHFGFERRDHLCALLSDDDGKSWSRPLLLDEREQVSYPDGTESPDGVVRVVYDRGRRTDKEILTATFTEEDIRAGRIVTSVGELRRVINRA